MRPLSDSGSREQISPLIHKRGILLFVFLSLLPPYPTSFLSHYVPPLFLFPHFLLCSFTTPTHPSLCSTHYICTPLPATLKSDPMLPHLLWGGSAFPRCYWFRHGSGPIRFERKLACRVKAPPRMKIISFLYCFVFAAAFIKILYFLPFFKFAAGCV